MTRIQWAPGIAVEVRRAAAGLVRRWSHLLPDWCALLSLDYRQDAELGTEAMGACSADTDHNCADLFLLGAWLEEDADRREWVIVHELSHVEVAPMANWTDQLIETMTDGPAKTLLREQWKSTCERVVSDLSYIHLRNRAKAA